MNLHPNTRRPIPGELKPAAAAKTIGLSVSTIRRLFHAGYVKGRQPSPRTIWLRKASLLALKRATETDPNFWENHPLNGF